MNTGKNKTNKKLLANLSMGVSVYFTLLLFLVLTIYALGHPIAAILSCAVVILVFFWYIQSRRVKQTEIIRYIETLAFQVDSATKESLLNFPLPMVVLDLSANIVWHNTLFSDVVDDSQVFERPISEVLPDVNIREILQSQEHIFIKTKHNERYFDVVGNRVESKFNDRSGTFSVILYLIERTEEHRLLQKNTDERSVACIVMVDNYEELLNNASDNVRATLTANIIRVINEWAAATNAVIINYEKDRYYLVFENKHLAQHLERKFDILDSIREISDGNKFPITVSIGIGAGSGGITDNDRFAKMAIDMALGRGGDQVVIKDDERFRFFGGRTAEHEKRTKVKSRVTAHALRELINQSERVFIMGHKNADADVLGSAAGLWRIVTNRGIRASIVMDTPNSMSTPVLSMLSEQSQLVGSFISDDEAISGMGNDSLLIIIDTHKASLVENPKLLEKAKNIVVIDHHRKSENAIDNAVLTYHEPYASSTSEMITELIQYIEEKPNLTPLEAQALYAGIMVDTKNFNFKTGARTFEAASFLRRMGADPLAVKRLFQTDIKLYVKKAKIIEGAEIFMDSIAIAKYRGTDDNLSILISQTADELLSISGISASFVLCSIGGKVLISARSMGKLNVQVVLEELGGGGHITSAGAQVSGKLSEVESLLKLAIEKVVNG